MRPWLLLFCCWWISGMAWAGSVSIVLSSEAKPYQDMAEGLKKQLTAQGHGVEFRFLDEVQTNLAGVKADLFVGVGSNAAHWLHQNLPEDTSLVYCLVPRHPFPQGQRPARGIVTEVELGEQFELIREALPGTRVIGALYRSDRADGIARIRFLESLLPPGMELTAVAVDQFSSFAKALDALLAQGIDLIWTEPDLEIYNRASVRTLLLDALRKRIPVFGFSANFVRSGALLGVEIELHQYSKQVAELCHKVLSGKLSSARVRDPLRPEYDVVVNLVVARKLSVHLPESLLKRAKALGGL